MGEAVCGSGEATGRAMAPDCVCERWRCPPRGTLRLFWPLTPEFPAGPGALRLTNDQGRTAQKVPISVAYTASHDVSKPPRTAAMRALSESRVGYAP